MDCRINPEENIDIKNEELIDILEILINKLKNVFVVTLKRDDKIFIHIDLISINNNRYVSIEDHIIECKKENDKYIVDSKSYENMFNIISLQIFDNDDNLIYLEMFNCLWNRKNDKIKELLVNLVKELGYFLTKENVKFN